MRMSLYPPPRRPSALPLRPVPPAAAALRAPADRAADTGRPSRHPRPLLDRERASLQVRGGGAGRVPTRLVHWNVLFLRFLFKNGVCCFFVVFSIFDSDIQSTQLSHFTTSIICFEQQTSHSRPFRNEEQPPLQISHDLDAS